MVALYVCVCLCVLHQLRTHISDTHHFVQLPFHLFLKICDSDELLQSENRRCVGVTGRETATIEATLFDNKK